MLCCRKYTDAIFCLWVFPNTNTMVFNARNAKCSHKCIVRITGTERTSNLKTPAEGGQSSQIF